MKSFGLLLLSFLSFSYPDICLEHKWFVISFRWLLCNSLVEILKWKVVLPNSLFLYLSSLRPRTNCRSVWIFWSLILLFDLLFKYPFLSLLIPLGLVIEKFFCVLLIEFEILWFCTQRLKWDACIEFFLLLLLLMLLLLNFINFCLNYELYSLLYWDVRIGFLVSMTLMIIINFSALKCLCSNFFRIRVLETLLEILWLI